MICRVIARVLIRNKLWGTFLTQSVLLISLLHIYLYLKSTINLPLTAMQYMEHRSVMVFIGRTQSSSQSVNSLQIKLFINVLCFMFSYYGGSLLGKCNCTCFNFVPHS